ncbi:hypothetical protein TIFTF001_021415 [Ficus carica]|uniref:Flowering time control protein FCA n=1 Tax=Ficus carica TaxID=3494 RepID=A0AA88ACP5_FICCA|nr:hypothetical protein TIFTF001_021415 [Ficus carica]
MVGLRDKVIVAMFDNYSVRINVHAAVKLLFPSNYFVHFSPYGFIEDIFSVRDEMKQIRGCGFVKFSHAEMALAAIKALNGTYTMRVNFICYGYMSWCFWLHKGCDHPLVVRFADPKKPRPGELRSNYIFSGTNFSPPYQELAARPTSNLGDSKPGQNWPNAPHLMQPFSSTSQPGTSVVSDACTTDAEFRNKVTIFSSCSPGCAETVPSDTTVKSNIRAAAVFSGKRTAGTASQRPQAVASNSTSTKVLVNTQIPELPECDWSEHTCPDGYKYYYNCVTCESMWEKPKEFALFEEQVKKQEQEQNPCDQPQSQSPVLSTQQPAQPQEIQNQTDVLHQKLQLEKPSMSAPLTIVELGMPRSFYAQASFFKFYD